ncbi:MAG TPA: glycosyltransferase family 2 protein [Gaiellaceae bacterium]|nr:glycosyltransferase family 2 protein [Gaiellaceae bacterium]
MKLSLMIPTFRSGETIERTLASVLAQEYRPLEVLVYDECSQDATREIVERLFATADPEIEARLLTSEHNSGPVRAWRVALHAITGDWCSFVWADDVLKPSYSTEMMAGAARAVEEGHRKIVTCSGEVERDGRVLPYYAADAGIATPVEYSEGIFLRRFPISQICSVYETRTARVVFDRHIEIENPRGFDYERHPYGNDVGFLSELAAEGGGVELIGERLVTNVLSSSSMTRRALHDHIWQHRWQYTFNLYRVWEWWVARGIPDASRVRDMAERRLALCSLMLGGHGARFRPRLYGKALRAYAEFRRFDYQVTHSTLDEHRGRIAARGQGSKQPSHSLT